MCVRRNRWRLIVSVIRSCAYGPLELQPLCCAVCAAPMAAADAKPTAFHFLQIVVRSTCARQLWRPATVSKVPWRFAKLISRRTNKRLRYLHTVQAGLHLVDTGWLLLSVKSFNVWIRRRFGRASLGLIVYHRWLLRHTSWGRVFPSATFFVDAGSVSLADISFAPPPPSSHHQPLRPFSQPLGAFSLISASFFDKSKLVSWSATTLWQFVFLNAAHISTSSRWFMRLQGLLCGRGYGFAASTTLPNTPFR